MAENNEPKPVPPEALATPPSFIPDRETPEAAEEREAQGLPPPPPLKYNHKPAAEAAAKQARKEPAHKEPAHQPAARK